ncbi:unnamed protein product [Schistosoma curassoni]|uniref:Uncharacterized protein n=1 Tax=Schistosoma curassoni TaxID=6186 RepID=A0A183KEI7_9TREM|nr:unnamed protein product [Schistosoma curassoni]
MFFCTIRPTVPDLSEKFSSTIYTGKMFPKSSVIHLLTDEGQ